MAVHTNAIMPGFIYQARFPEDNLEATAVYIKHSGLISGNPTCIPIWNFITVFVVKGNFL